MIKNREIYLILDNIRSRENVGSIFRTADAVGVSKIYLCGITPRPKTNDELRIMNYDSDKIAKTALGAEKAVPYEYIRDSWRIVTRLKMEGVFVVALEQTKDSVNIFKVKLSRSSGGSVALVVGYEVNGVSASVLSRADKKISIPMYGKKESLNVSVATGIALYALINA